MTTAATAQPLVSVLVATRGTRPQLRQLLRSLQGSTYAPSETIVIVDRAPHELDAAEFGERLAAAGFQVQCVQNRRRRGISGARNMGLSCARGEIIAFTDDDCTVSAVWLERIVERLRQPSPPGLVCGALEPIPHDTRRDYVPMFRPAAPTRLSHRFVRPWALGVGANMAARRTTLETLGGLDERLGVGASFLAAEDTHLAYRVLRRGAEIELDPSNAVIHWGVRPTGDGTARRLTRASWYGMGACYGLLAADGDAVAGVVFGRELAGQAIALVGPLESGAPTTLAWRYARSRVFRRVCATGYTGHLGSGRVQTW